jgi:hypothetical protein
LFPGNKYRINIDFITIVGESDKYPHLKYLLIDEKANLHFEEIRLRDFVEIMLQLKHHSTVKEFLDIYEVIVEEVMGASFNNARNPADRLAFLDSVE